MPSSLAHRWETFLERIRPPRRAIPTRAGLFVLASPLPLGLAAVTASNNLLFMILAAALSTIVISGILSERNLRGVRVRLRPVGAVWAEEPALVRVSFEHPGPTRPRYGLRIRERIAGFGAWWKDQGRDDRLNGQLVVLDGVRGDVVAHRRFSRRGRARFGRLELSTRFPFGLLEKARDVESEVEVFVRPRRVPLPPELWRPVARDRTGQLSARRGAGLDVYGLRERNDRDDVLRIHALRSLALGREVVVETAGVERPAAWLAVAAGPQTNAEAFERALEIAAAAAICWDKAGWAVGISLPGRIMPPGQTSVDGLLDALALQEGLTDPTVARGAVWLVPQGASPPDGQKAFFVSASGALEEASP